MKTFFLLITGVCLLSGCQATGGLMKNSVSFQINDHLKNQDVVYRNNWPECYNLSRTPNNIKNQKYITTYSDCKVSPEGYVPQQIIIDYVPWLTREQLLSKGLAIPEEMRYSDKPEDTVNRKSIRNAEQQAIEKLPASAWKRIVLTPPTEVAKYKLQSPEGKGNPRRGKEINYLISLNPDGTYQIETKLYWVEPYQKNWN